MAFPMINPATVRAALSWSRRLLKAYRFVGDLRDVSDALLSTPDDIKEGYSPLPGDKVILYVIGRNMLKDPDLIPGVNESVAHALAMGAIAIVNSQTVPSSVDHLVAAYGFQLGRIAQCYNPAFYSRLEKAIASWRPFTHTASNDSMTLLDELAKSGAADNLAHQAFQALGLSATEWGTLAQAALNRKGTIRIQETDEATNRLRSINDIFPGYLLAGARAASWNIPQDVHATEGADAVRISAAFLRVPSVPVVSRWYLSARPIFTLAVVDAYTHKLMDYLGYIQVEGKWEETSQFKLNEHFDPHQDGSPRYVPAEYVEDQPDDPMEAALQGILNTNVERLARQLATRARVAVKRWRKPPPSSGTKKGTRKK